MSGDTLVKPAGRLTNQYCYPRCLQEKEPAAGATGYFKNCTDMNGWTKNKDNLKLLQVHLVEKAKNAYRRLGEDDHADHSKCTDAVLTYTARGRYK